MLCKSTIISSDTTIIISTTMPSDPGALLFLNFLFAISISAQNISGSSSRHFSHFSSALLLLYAIRDSQYFFYLFFTFSLLISSLPYWFLIGMKRSSNDRVMISLVPFLGLCSISSIYLVNVFVSVFSAFLSNFCVFYFMLLSRFFQV